MTSMKARIIWNNNNVSGANNRLITHGYQEHELVREQHHSTTFYPNFTNRRIYIISAIKHNGYCLLNMDWR